MLNNICSKFPQLEYKKTELYLGTKTQLFKFFLVLMQSNIYFSDTNLSLLFMIKNNYYYFTDAVLVKDY